MYEKKSWKLPKQRLPELLHSLIPHEKYVGRFLEICGQRKGVVMI